ncbi:hypothetical protein SGQ44_03905 [Flavobacterium sp. Fl-77]|uniref:Addiction module protein n=1 Tax=Flavobacterium flavipigmentatum TaxID=2893884 RepID=A0AAJ2SBQ4_9FLAO|nr:MULTISPECIES: hypothetical protein [unclassified Flavobacterium]MDX6181281.1 hypothetical protein [Flavobacterium sp. Fl-33]MDX6184882.1 hypothetical protein [Flavobacterium sp. Fl-77]UFH39974.1 hypothetical protein LNP22_06795 [Flavobacterium sp. F-70]
MDIQLEKLELIKMLAETEDPAIIKSIQKIFKKEKKDWWDDLNEFQKEEIRLAEKQIENGEYSDFESFIKKYI